MLQISPTLSIDLTTGILTPSDAIVSQANLAITLTGTGSLVNSNMKAVLYRLNRAGVDGTLVATCDTFTGPANAFVGSMDLNTAETLAAFAALQSVRRWEKAAFDIIIYDASTDQYLLWDKIEVSYDLSLAAATPGSVSPITSSTITWGNLKLISGVIHRQSVTDGEWYPLTLAGSDETIHEVIGETGIP